jgi:hypothetical protein
MDPLEPKLPVPARLRSWLPRAIFESSLIVFSVLLALALNEWRAGAAQRDRAAQALEAIRGELEENRRLVLDSREYHVGLAASFQQALETGAEKPDLEAMGRGLLSPALVRRNAWESAQNTDLLAHLPYETILRLSTVYAHQAMYEDVSRALAQVAYQQAILEGFEAMIRHYPRYILIQNDVAGKERVLDVYYAEALESLPERTRSLARR